MNAVLTLNVTLQFLIATMMALVLSGSSIVAQIAPIETAEAEEPAGAVVAADDYEPLKGKTRLKWVMRNSISPRRFAGYVITSAIGTGTNAPPEYGPHWDGFAKRIALRASTSTTGMFLEAGIGTLWDEDPRYVRTEGKPVKGRVLNAVKMAFLARNGRGEVVPAYARYISIPTSAFVTRTWRPDSQTGISRTVSRIPLSFLDRIISNAFTEFGPDIRKRLGRKP